jgi:hypothetical protein
LIDDKKETDVNYLTLSCARDGCSRFQGTTDVINNRTKDLSGKEKTRAIRLLSWHRRLRAMLIQRIQLCEVDRDRL